MANIAKWMLDLIGNPKTAKFVETLKHSDLPKNWANDPEVIRLAEKAYQQGRTESPFFKAYFQGSKAVDENGNPLVVYHGTDNVFDAFDDKMIASNTGNYGHYGKGHYTTTDKAEAETYGKNVMPLYMRTLNPENLNVSANREKYLPDFLGMEPEILGVSDDWIKSAVRKKYPQAENFIDAIYKNADDDAYFNAYQLAKKGGLSGETIENIGDFIRYNSKDLNNGGIDDSVLMDSMKLFGEMPKIEKGYKNVPDASYITNMGMYGKDFADAVKKNGYDSVIGGGTERVAFEPTQLKSVKNRGTFNPDDPNIYRALAPVGVGLGTLAAAGMLPDDAEAASFSGLKNLGKQTLDYMMSHRPLPDEELSMGLHDLNEVFPGIYGNAARNYKTGAGDKIDREALDAIMMAKGNPDAMIDIYRAVPKGVKDFNVGDWVTTSKSYAKNHGEGPLKGEYDLITTKARASDIAEPGDSIAEQGYWGPKVTGSLTKGYLPFGIGLGTLASAGFLPDREASAKSAYINSPEMKAAMMGIRDEPVKEAWNPVEAFATAPIGAFTTGARAASVGIDALLSALLGD